jgi:molybdopterin/thiamine biosynthesis adenylyltransferase
MFCPFRDMEGPLRIGSADDDRYDRARRVVWLDMDAVFRSGVLVVGAGALGNEVAKNLALSGFRRVTVVDHDEVSTSNLARCLFFSKADADARRSKADVVAARIADLSPDTDTRALVARVEDISDAVFEDHDVVLGCLDNIAARMNTNSRAFAAGMPFVDGGMNGFVGRVTTVLPPDGPCLQCMMNRTHAKVASMHFSCTGRRDVVFHEPVVPAEITTTSVVSAIMVRESLKIVSGRTDMITSRLFYYDGGRGVSEELDVEVNPDCPVHRAPTSPTSIRNG